MSVEIRHPDFTYHPNSFLKYPWRLRWKYLPLPWHYGGEFRSNFRLLSSSWGWNASQIEAYQFSKLKSLLEHAYRTVPYYREVFDQQKIRLADFRRLKDFSQFPILTRQQIVDNLAALKSSESERHNPIPSETSGTTSMPLKFFRSRAVEKLRLAAQWRHFQEIGYKFKQPRVSLNATFSGKEEHLLYRYDAVENHVALNGRFLIAEGVGALCELIRDFSPIMFYGHPSALSTLATLMKRLDLRPLNVPVVFLYSEIVSDSIRKRIKDYVGSNIHDYYGNRENTVSACEFRCGHYHVNSEMVYLELADSDQQFHGENLHRVIGTNLVNYVMPLIRYDSDDLAISMGQCPNCQIAHPTIKFLGGRVKNFLVSRQGLLHCQFDDFLHDEGYDRVEDFQIVQNDLDNLVLRLVPGGRFQKDTDEPKIVELLASSTHHRFQIAVEYVDSLPATRGFKKVKILSRLGEQELTGDSNNGIKQSPYPAIGC